MDLNGPNSPSRFHRHRQSPTSDRLLGAHPPDNPSSSTATTDDELNEDDIFTTDFSQQNHHNHITPSNSPSSAHSRHLHNNNNKNNRNNYQHPELSGILAALPKTSNNHHFYHKAWLSTSASSTASSSSSSSSMISSIPKPVQERIPLPSSSVGVKHHQSAPVNVPVFSQAMRKHREFDEVDLDEDEEEEGEMLPPHEIVTRGSAQSPFLACSVLEGVGRTLKGRDLRQVRNAIWRRTGFLD